MTNRETAKQEAIIKLREILKPGDTVYTTLKHVSRTGMSRSIDLHVIRENKPIWISALASKAADFTFDDKRAAVKVNGCGMDMGFSVVYELSHVLFPQGFGVKGQLSMGRDIRPTSKENAAEAVKRGAKFYGRNGDTSGWDNDGGYALKQEWL